MVATRGLRRIPQAWGVGLGDRSGGLATPNPGLEKHLYKAIGYVSFGAVPPSLYPSYSHLVLRGCETDDGAVLTKPSGAKSSHNTKTHLEGVNPWTRS